jgi:hypothetical protein
MEWTLVRFSIVSSQLLLGCKVVRGYSLQLECPIY